MTTPTADFIAAQDGLRSTFGTVVQFLVPTVATWPAGTKINPDTGEPYDSTAVRANAGFTSTDIKVLVILKQGSPLRPQADTHFDPVGMQSGMDIIIDVGAADWQSVSGASEMTVVGLHYKIEEAKVFALGGIVYRYLVYGMQK